MLDATTESEIRRLRYAEHWKIGTIASQLGVHTDAVRWVLSRPPGQRAPSPPRRRITDPFVSLITETLQRYPRLRATVLYRMLRSIRYLRESFFAAFSFTTLDILNESVPIPPQAVGLDLTLVTTDSEIRLLQGAQEIARHRRCYDQGQRVTDPAHTARRPGLGARLALARLPGDLLTRSS